MYRSFPRELGYAWRSWVTALWRRRCYALGYQSPSDPPPIFSIYLAVGSLVGLGPVNLPVTLPFHSLLVAWLLWSPLVEPERRLVVGYVVVEAGGGRGGGGGAYSFVACLPLSFDR